MKLSILVTAIFVFLAIVALLGGLYYSSNVTSSVITEDLKAQNIDGGLAENLSQHYNDFLAQNLVVFLIVVVLAVALVSYFITELTSRPLRKLNENLTEITKGNFDVKLPSSRITEVNDLSNSLNRILSSFKLAIKYTGLSKDKIGLSEAIQSQKETESKYQKVFNQVTDAIYIHDLDGHFLDVNNTAVKRMGYTRDEFLKMGPMDIDDPKNAKLVPKRIHDLKENKMILFNTYHITKKGKKIPVEIHSTTFKYGDKDAILSVARDLTETQRLETFEDTYDAIPILIYNIGLDGIIKNCNEKVVKTLGYKNKNDLIGKPLISFIYSLASQKKAKDLFELWKKTGSISDKHMVILTKQGKEIPVILNAKMIYDANGDPIHSISVHELVR